MTDCTGKQLVFSRLKRQQIVADFDGGRLTSDAGAPVRERHLDHGIRLVRAGGKSQLSAALDPGAVGG
ncbi:MAG: hypothetical protein ACYSUQ_05380 [Planctomycetota bacterium]